MPPDPALSAPRLFFAMKLRVEVAPPIELGKAHGVARRIVPITGGSFEGPKLQGQVLPGGVDSQYTRPDDVVVLEARYTLQTAEGHFISVTNRGFRHGAPGLAAMLAAGYVPPTQYYFMTAPLFETASPALQWLTRTIFIGQAERSAEIVLVTVWQVGDAIMPARA